MQRPQYQPSKAAAIVRETVLWLMTVGGTIGAVVFGALGGEPSKDQTRQLVFAGVCAFLPIIATGVTRIRIRRAQQAQLEAEGRSLVGFNSALSSAVYYLGRMAAADDSRMKTIYGGHFIHAVVSAASILCSAPDSRSVFFRIQKNEMACESYSGHEGRADPSPTVFRDEVDDRAGQHMFQLVRSRQSVLYPDILKEAPPGLVPNRSYRTFIVASVAAGECVYGALTIDSPQPNALSSADFAMMKTLAGLLGAGLALMPESG